MRVLYESGSDTRTPLKVFYLDDTIGLMRNNNVTLRLNKLVLMLLTAYNLGKRGNSLVIAKIKKGDRDG